MADLLTPQLIVQAINVKKKIQLAFAEGSNDPNEVVWTFDIEKSVARMLDAELLNVKKVEMVFRSLPEPPEPKSDAIHSVIITSKNSQRIIAEVCQDVWR